MYKLSEIANRFKIGKKVLIKELIENEKILKNHTKKENGLTYVDDKGIELLYNIFFKNEDLKKNKKEDNEDIDKLNQKIKEYKLKILDLDSEIYQKNEILSEYQNKLLNINRKILNFNK
ncbi:MAG: hypothetical protein ACQEQE_10590 [Bacillota bacterium]